MKTVGDYELLELIGTGSYGRVYTCARRDAGGSDAAEPQVMKLVNVACLSKHDAEGCLNEVRVLAKLAQAGCRYIIRYSTSFLDDEAASLCVVMEHAGGGTLAQLIQRSSASGGLSKADVWRLFIQLCCALYVVHEAGILHRDLKSANVFLTSDRQVRLGDFGLSRVLSHSASLATSLVGTPYYLSPEMCHGEAYSSKSDIWALGVLLYEMCTSAVPFKANNQAALVFQIVRGKVNKQSISAVEEKHGTHAGHVILSCLRKAPSARPSVHQILSARDLICEAHLHGVVIPAGCLPHVGTAKRCRDVLSQSAVYKDEVCKAIRAHPLDASTSFVAAVPPPPPPPPPVSQPSQPAQPSRYAQERAAQLLKHQSGLPPSRRTRRGAAGRIPAAAASAAPAAPGAPAAIVPKVYMPHPSHPHHPSNHPAAPVLSTVYRSRKARQRDIHLVQALPDVVERPTSRASEVSDAYVCATADENEGSPGQGESEGEDERSPVLSFGVGDEAAAASADAASSLPPCDDASSDGAGVTHDDDDALSSQGSSGDEGAATGHQRGRLVQAVRWRVTDGCDLQEATGEARTLSVTLREGDGSEVEESEVEGDAAALAEEDEESTDDTEMSIERRRRELSEQVAAASTELKMCGCDDALYENLTQVLDTSQPAVVHGDMPPETVSIMRLVHKKALLEAELREFVTPTPHPSHA